MIKEYVGADAERITRIVRELSTENERLSGENDTLIEDNKQLRDLIWRNVDIMNCTEADAKIVAACNPESPTNV